MSVGGGGEPKSVIDGKRRRLQCLRPACWGGRKRAGDTDPIRNELRCRVSLAGRLFEVFDCAAAEAYYVGDIATIEAGDERKAVILKVES